jgi:thiol-disulfide isomerase/thioredoxin
MLNIASMNYRYIVMGLIMAMVSQFGIAQSAFSITAPKEDAGVKNIKHVTFDQLERRFRSGGDTVYVVNFWATWCKPCVAELPYLEAYQSANEGKKVKVLLVSVDFERHVDTKLIPFVEKNAIQCEVVHLDAPKANDWIDRVSPEWSGAIPATIARKGTREYFHEGSFPDIKGVEKFVNKVH